MQTMVDSPAADRRHDDDFGEREPGRFGADVRYTGRVRGHDYVVEVRHRLLDTSAVLTIDGVRHDPRTEKEAARSTHAQDVDAEDGIAVRIDEGFTRLRYTVRRPTVKGEMKDRERIIVRTAGLGGAGEVDVAGDDSFVGSPLVPQEGSPSARREQRKTEHPLRYGLIAALGAAARVLIPLLGIGALLSGLLRPLREAAERAVRPPVEWVADLVRPVKEWIADLLRPVGKALTWLLDLLFGWIPDLGIHVPSWMIDVGVPMVMVLLAFLATVAGIRHRRALLSEAERERDEQQDREPGEGAD